MGELTNKIRRLLLLRRNASVANVNREFVSLRSAKILGVLYKADQPYSELLIKKLTVWCEQNNLRLLALGYINDKELSGTHAPHRYSDYFCNRQLNRFKLPEKSKFVRFAGERMDYLLNLYCEPCIPLLGISAMQESGFRVGFHMPDYKFCFDMMLNTPQKDVLMFTDELLAYIKKFGNG